VNPRLTQGSSTTPHEAKLARVSGAGDSDISVPFTTVLTYTERPALSQKLEALLCEPHANSELAHAVAVTGLGGTGKTQLVLRYIETHRNLYTAVFWLDARSERALCSSFERCCATLALPTTAPAVHNATLLRDVPAIQTVLRWLLSQPKENPWLLVIDNADDLKSGIKDVIPRGQAGSVILISQDGGTPRILGKGCRAVSVDAMEIEEATSLLWNAVGEPRTVPDEATTKLLESIVRSLDRLPLAVDLAGAGIEADVGYGEDIHKALRSYIRDFRAHQDSLMKRNDFSISTTYGKTVWTAWETSFGSLSTIDDGSGDILPRQLLSFLTSFDCANIQEDLFRLASLGFRAMSPQYGEFQPWWLARILQRGTDDEWDDYTYRETVKILRRFGFIRPVSGQWKGLTMHGLVQWRAKAIITNHDHMWQTYLLFIGAVCQELLTEDDNVAFRRHLILHLPTCGQLLQPRSNVDQELVGRVWANIGLVWQREGHLAVSEQLLSAALNLWQQRLGNDNPVTLFATMDLAKTLRFQGRLLEAEQLMLSASGTMSAIMGDECPETLTALSFLALTYRDQGRWAESKELHLKVLAIRTRVLGEQDSDTIHTMSYIASICRSQGLLHEAERLASRVLEARSRTLGAEHPDTLIMRADNAVTYSSDGRWREAEGTCSQVIAAFSEIYGEQHPSTMAAVAKLASSHFHRKRFVDATQLFSKVVEARLRIFGERHPQTLTVMSNMAHSLRGSGNLRDTIGIMKKVEVLSEETHGTEHPYSVCRGQYVIDWEDELAWQ
jgi:tetratricopeptide (TPR) repeat protein